MVIPFDQIYQYFYLRILAQICENLTQPFEIRFKAAFSPLQFSILGYRHLIAVIQEMYKA